MRAASGETKMMLDLVVGDYVLNHLEETIDVENITYVIF